MKSRDYNFIKGVSEMGVKDVYREVRISKAGNQYQVLCIVFENGYKYENFLSNEQQYILTDVPVRK